ncbi:hypothetical protein FOL47_006573 [Perkinsus chesapeaki]|uniref:Uncharacterized protein n=1 Tax=Perkinsus chesapeaki TaxID=330153 RepID=A0A7J6MX44_PERCH|nr:hypothetical protein FOL47_006573 [Perkinsus chesapeaki]
MLFNLGRKSSTSCKIDNTLMPGSRDDLGSPKSPTESTTSSSFSTSTAPTDGILRRAGDSCDNIRYDRRGNFIHFGSKSHSISFADEIEGDNEPLENVFIVESWKAYNSEETAMARGAHRGCFSLRSIFS